MAHASERYVSGPLRRVLGAALSTFVLATASGCERKADEAPESPGASLVGTEDKLHQPGELGTAQDFTMSIETVQTCNVSPPFAPPKGKKKIGVEVVIEGKSEREIPVNPFYAELRDGEGETYETTLAGCKPPLEARRVTHGQTARGFISFEVPERARKLQMTYAPTIIGGGRQSLRFELGQ